MPRKTKLPVLADLVKSLPSNVRRVRVFADGSYEVEIATDEKPVAVDPFQIPLAPGLPGSTMEAKRKRATDGEKKEIKKLSDLDSLTMKPPSFDS